MPRHHYTREQKSIDDFIMRIINDSPGISDKGLIKHVKKHLNRKDGKKLIHSQNIRPSIIRLEKHSRILRVHHTRCVGEYDIDEIVSFPLIV